MYLYFVVFTFASAAFAVAPNPAVPKPANSTFCDYYTSKDFTGNLSSGNIPADQVRAMVTLVNIAFSGNNTEAPNDVNISGILNNGTVNGTTVNLLKYFDGSLLSTNRGGKAVSVDFLDGGGSQYLASIPPNTNQ
jgi:hypothetical protein